MDQQRIDINDQHWLAVTGPEGAVAFSWFDPAFRPDRDGKMAGDLAIHSLASADYKYGYPCNFLGERECAMAGWSSPETLDILIDEGEDAVFAKLTDIYTSSFLKES